jgi:multicomponent Na+:H+ antiporter subunit D
VWPDPLYALLPYTVDFAPYTTTHVITQLQLLLFSALAFAVLMRTGLYPPEMRLVNLDFDWSYRRLLPAAVTFFLTCCRPTRDRLLATAKHRIERFIAGVFRHHGPEGILARTWPTGSTVLWVAVLLALYLVIYFV